MVDQCGVIAGGPGRMGSLFYNYKRRFTGFYNVRNDIWSNTLHSKWAVADTGHKIYFQNMRDRAEEADLDATFSFGIINFPVLPDLWPRFIKRFHHIKVSGCLYDYPDIWRMVL